MGSAGWDQYYGYGRINAFRALNDLEPKDVGNLDGYVKDLNTDYPIADALVTVVGTGKSASTDSDGYYLITDIPVVHLMLKLKQVITIQKHKQVYL